MAAEAGLQTPVNRPHEPDPNRSRTPYAERGTGSAQPPVMAVPVLPGKHSEDLNKIKSQNKFLLSGLQQAERDLNAQCLLIRGFPAAEPDDKRLARVREHMTDLGMESRKATELYTEVNMKTGFRPTASLCKFQNPSAATDAMIKAGKGKGKSRAAGVLSYVRPWTRSQQEQQMAGNTLAKKLGMTTKHMSTKAGLTTLIKPTADGELFTVLTFDGWCMNIWHLASDYDRISQACRSMDKELPWQLTLNTVGKLDSEVWKQEGTRMLDMEKRRRSEAKQGKGSGTSSGPSTAAAATTEAEKDRELAQLRAQLAEMKAAKEEPNSVMQD